MENMFMFIANILLTPPAGKPRKLFSPRKISHSG